MRQSSDGIGPDLLLGVGMGLAAPINRLTGELDAEGILPGWRGIRPAAEMQARLGVSVQLENDANVGALGEKIFGAARGVDELVYVLLSAGIGAGIILGGRPYQGVSGVAGEIDTIYGSEGEELGGYVLKNLGPKPGANYGNVLIGKGYLGGSL